MAKVQYFESEARCGHTESIAGRWIKNGYRSFSLAPLSSHVLCHGCYNTVQAILSTTEPPAKPDADFELPKLAQLQGTDKQVAWASTIRAKYVEQTAARLQALQAALEAETDDDSRRTLIALNTILLYVLRQASGATFWIEYRSKNILPYDKLEKAMDLTFGFGRIKGDGDREQSQRRKIFNDLGDLLLKTDWQIKADQRRQRAWR